MEKIKEECIECGKLLKETKEVVKNRNGGKEFCNIDCWNKFMNRRAEDTDWDKLKKYDILPYPKG